MSDIDALGRNPLELIYLTSYWKFDTVNVYFKSMIFLYIIISGVSRGAILSFYNEATCINLSDNVHIGLLNLILITF